MIKNDEIIKKMIFKQNFAVLLDKGFKI